MSEVENHKDVELLIWMNGKTKEFSFRYKIEDISHISLTSIRLKFLLSKYIFDNNKLYTLLNIPPNAELIQHLYTKNEVELEDFDIPHLKNNDILFFSFDTFSSYKSSNNFYQYEFIKWIKSGGFGKVFLAKEVATNKEYAIKEISVKNFSNEELYNISREYMILKEMSHKNIINFHTFYTYDNKFYIVMDYAQGGELSNLLDDKIKLSEEEAKFIFKQIYNAVCYIHGKNIIHRDLKPNNILFFDKEKTHIVIIDFGISGVSNGNQREKIKAGTVKFIPPEMLSGKEFSSSPRLDMWALGVILYRMVEGCYPFEGKNYKETINNIFKSKLEFNPKIKISSPLRHLLEGLLEKNYRFRIDSDNKLFNQWFENKLVINNNAKKKVKKNESDDDIYNIDYLNKYYSIDRYSKYYEDENERKIIQSLSNKSCNNNYLSQTKSTSMKVKPKVFYIKNDYSYMKKNSLPYKIELNRSGKKKSLEKIKTVEEKESDNENEKNSIDNSNNINNKKIILPLINNKKCNRYNLDNSESKIFDDRNNKIKKSYIGQRVKLNINLFNNNNNKSCNNTNYFVNSIETFNNSNLNNMQFSSSKYNNSILKLTQKQFEMGDLLYKSINNYKNKNSYNSKQLFSFSNRK